MKKCMEFRAEGRRPVGRPRRAWLESEEAAMAKLEIDKGDVHARKSDFVYHVSSMGRVLDFRADGPEVKSRLRPDKTY